MKVYGHMVVRNEANRYLVPALTHLMPLVDTMFVFDDQSDDGTPEIASGLNCEVAVRGSEAPSFLEHEGRFRQVAWRAFEEWLDPEPGDWVLSLDADEVLVGERLVNTVRYELPEWCAEHGAVGVELPVAEVFGVRDERPMVRVDGHWGSITAVRLFEYRPDGRFPDRAMACGSVPDYVTAGNTVRVPEGLGILHFGYLDPGDRGERYERYQRHPLGHSESHIASILQPPVTERWPGVPVLLERGA